MTEPTTAELPDAALMAAVAARDEAAFGELYDRYAPTLYAIGLRILRKTHDAEALLSDVFMEIWRDAGRYNPKRGAVRTYITVLTRCRAIDRLRSSMGRSTHEATFREEQRAHPTESHRDDDPANIAISHEEGQIVRTGLAALSDAQREALELAFFEGLTHREIAARLDSPLGTVKTHIRQGMIKLGYVVRASQGKGSQP